MARRDSILVSRTLYQVGIVTLVASIMWVGIGIYLAMIEPLNVEVEKKWLEPINPSIDQEVVDQLAGRLKVEESEATSSAIIEEGGTDELAN